MVALLARSSNTNPLVNPTSTVFEILEGSEPTLCNLLLLAFVATGDTTYLNDYASKTRKSGREIRSILSPETCQTCRNEFERRVKISISEELTWSGYENIICYVHFEALVHSKDTQRLEDTEFYSHAAQTLSRILSGLQASLAVHSRPCEALYEK